MRAFLMVAPQGHPQDTVLVRPLYTSEQSSLADRRTRTNEDPELECERSPPPALGIPALDPELWGRTLGKWQLPVTPTYWAAKRS